MNVGGSLDAFTTPSVVGNRFTNVHGGYIKQGKKVDIYIIADATTNFSGSGDMFTEIPMPIDNTYIPLNAFLLKKQSDGRYGDRVAFNECMVYLNSTGTNAYIYMGGGSITPMSDTYRVVIIGTYYCN